MKTFAEILEAVRHASAAITAAEEHEKELTAAICAELDRDARRAKWGDYKTELNASTETRRTLSLGLRLLQNNARVALYHEVMPAVIEVLERYKGKPYGDKTRAKIADELYQRTGARVYFSTKWGDVDEVTICPDTHGNTYLLTVGTAYDSEKREHLRIFDGNRLQPLPLESFRLCYVKSEYIEDIPAAIASMQTLHARAVALKRELRAVCSEFNGYAVEGIDSLDADRHIYETLTAN